MLWIRAIHVSSTFCRHNANEASRGAASSCGCCVLDHPALRSPSSRARAETGSAKYIDKQQNKVLRQFPMTPSLKNEAQLQILRSANAQVGESVAEFFPKIGLTALLGKVSPELSAFTLGGANAWGIAAEGTGPLFEGGRLVGQYRQTKAARLEAELRYRQNILYAFREVADALISRLRLLEIREYQGREVTALETAVKLSTERYVAGKADYYEVLEAQQQLFPAQLNLARTQRDQLLSVVTLYKALGGGWQDETKSNQHL